MQSLRELQCRLADLAILSAGQSPALTAAEWKDVLKRKQKVLDAIEVSHPARLFQHAHAAIDVLKHGGCPELARHLELALRFNREAFQRLAAKEEQAREQLDEQVSAVRERLVVRQQHRMACRAYRARPEGQSLFLNGRR